MNELCLIKALEMANAYKKDFEEFGSTFSSETSGIIEKVSTTAKTITKSLSEGDNSIDESFEKLQKGVVAIKENILSLVDDISSTISKQNNDDVDSNFDTNVNDIEDKEEFYEWLKNFKLESKAEDISNLLSSNQGINDLYRNLVPDTLTPQEFWGRYYFKLQQSQLKEQKRIELMEKAEKMIKLEDDIEWDNDKDEENNVHNNNSNQNESKIEVQKIKDVNDDDAFDWE